jgi:hypothetical protein
MCIASPLSAEETVLKTAPVPNRLLRQGDAILFTRDQDKGVRIELNTRHLNKVRKKIIESEKTHWPDSADSLAYQTALNTACDEALKNGKGVLKFTIEWIRHPDGNGTVYITSEEDTQTLTELSPAYLEKNMIFILIDRFDLTQTEAKALLTPDNKKPTPNN